MSKSVTPPVNFESYLRLLRELRNSLGVEAPTEDEIEDWRAEWQGWRHERRVREMKLVEANLIISGG